MYTCWEHRNWKGSREDYLKVKTLCNRCDHQPTQNELQNIIDWLLLDKPNTNNGKTAYHLSKLRDELYND